MKFERKMNLTEGEKGEDLGWEAKQVKNPLEDEATPEI